MKEVGEFVSRTEYFEAKEIKVGRSENYGRIYLPKEWIGKKVKVLLLEPINNGRHDMSKFSGKKGEG